MKTGKIEFILSNIGSKSEGVRPYLVSEDGKRTPVYKEGDISFNGKALKPYEGKLVEVTGEENEYGKFGIETIKIIDPEVVEETPAEAKAAPVEDTPAEETAEKEAEPREDTADGDCKECEKCDCTEPCEKDEDASEEKKD